MPRYDKADVKAAARGREGELLTALGGIPAELLDGKHHPCPLCHQGTDCFRLVDADAGAVLCNKCFAENNGDYLAAIMKATGKSFPEVLALVGEYVGARPINSNGQASGLDPLELLCRAKRMPRDAALAYGARVDGKAVVFPSWSENGTAADCFTIATSGSDKQRKGLWPKGGKAGVFLPIVDGSPRVPQPGETWLIVEGVKDAAALAGLGYLAMGLPTCKLNQKFVQLLRGVHVVLVPDRDSPSVNGMEEAARKLYGVAESVRIAALPAEVTPKEGADVRDILAKQDGERLVREAIDQASVWQLPPDDGDQGQQIHNAQMRFTVNDDGEEGREIVALPMPKVIEQITGATDGWPRRVDNALFVNGDLNGVSWLRTPAALFGWMGSVAGVVDWHKTRGCVTKEEAFNELQRTATKYAAVEDLPHEPAIDGHYYACERIESGDGRLLREFLERFAPLTPLDRDLMLAAMLTPFWGGPGGMRPCFTVTTDDGPGVGKSTFVHLIGDLAGGILSFDRGEQVGEIKTRLLSPDAITKRVALLDNVKSLKFSWGELEGLITASTVSGKRMYTGEGSRPNTITWFITLNGANLSTDMAQRSVIIKVKRPDRSSTWDEDTRRFLHDHRAGLVADLLGILRSKGAPLEKFTRWAMWERAVLSRLPEPAEAQAVIAERQGSVDAEQEENEIVETYFAEQLQRLGYWPARDLVFVPVQIAAQWLGRATNESHTTVTGASRHLRQMIAAKRFTSLRESDSRANGRGFIWAGVESFGGQIRTDLASRMASLRGEEPA